MQKTNYYTIQILATLSKIFLIICVCLTLWATLPKLFGFTSTTVISESMHPTLKVSDVIITKPTPTNQAKPGRIALVKDTSPQQKLTLHRIQNIAENGEITLKGDANPSLDKPIPAENFIGHAILRIPYIGLPFTLYRNQNWLGLSLLTILLIATSYLSQKTKQTKP